MSGPALVVPIKVLVGAKQRLASRLTAPERRLLALAMAGDTLRLVCAVLPAARVCVVSGDDEVRRLADRQGVSSVADRGVGQSSAVRVGVAWARERGHTSVATIAADCPLATMDDVDRLLAAAARRGRFLACAPDSADRGTNAAALRPLTIDPWRFGPDSLRRHRGAAGACGLRFEVLGLESLRADCDRSADLELVGASPRPTATFHVLRQLGLAHRVAAAKV